jgi:pimeloyl-ACP methyl ester carboxylesterase
MARPRRRKLRLRDGIEIALLDYGGEGPLALLHHANGFCAGVWGLVADELVRTHRVIAMDARGHGESSKPESPGAYAWARFAEDVAEVGRQLVGELGSSRVGLGLGHSFGGTSILAAAADAPDLFERILLVDPVILPPPDLRARLYPGKGNHMSERALRRPARFASRDEARARWKTRRMFRHWDPRALELYLEYGLAERPDGSVELRCPPQVEAAIFAAGVDFDLFERASRVRVPALLLWARDGDFPRAVYEAVAARMPDARIEEIAAGHLVPMERPELVVEAARRFAGRT